MEFYLDLFFDLCRLGQKFLGVFTGSKCMVAMQVCIFVDLFNIDLKCGYVSYYPQVKNVYGSST